MSDIDTAVVDSLKALDPKRPIREADIGQLFNESCSKVAPDPFPMPRLRASTMPSSAPGSYMWLSVGEHSLDDFFRSFLGTGLDSKDIDVLQMALRAVIIYVVTICIVRIGKKRFMGGATVFDVILGIIVGSVASRAITGNAPLLPASGAIAVLVGLHWSFSAIAVRSRSFGQLIKGSTDVIIRDGQIDYDRLREEHMSDGDLAEDLRSEGVADARDVLEARLERNGKLSVIKKKP